MNSPFLQETKSGFDFTPWGGIEGFLEASKQGTVGNGLALKKLVPDLSRAIDMTAVSIARMPFEFCRPDGKVFDSSEDWENKIGGIPNPQRLLYLIASSLCGGAAYVIPRRTPRMIFDLQYVAPHTITPQIRREGLQYFDRTTDQGKFDKVMPNKILYFWLPDSDVEIGPALNTPLSNAMADAQLSLNVKNTMRIYGERGFVPITLLGASGMPNDGERKKAEGFFDRLLKGGFDVLAKIVNSDALTLIKVGAGMEELKGSYVEILRQSKEDIAQAFGIPTALFMSDNAFASEFDVLRKSFYTSSRFVSIYQTIEETFNDQLLKPYDLQMYFRPETMDMFQEDEAKRSVSLGQLVSAISTDPNIAKFGMEILGYDLSEEQETELETLVAAKEEQKAKEEAAAQEQMAFDRELMMNKQKADVKPTDKKPTEKPVKKSLVLSPDETKDLSLWFSKAKAWNASGKGNAVDWENKHLREEVAAPIRAKLTSAVSPLDVVKAFEIGEVEEKSDIELLAEAINNAANTPKGN